MTPLPPHSTATILRKPWVRHALSGQMGNSSRKIVVISAGGTERGGVR
jgi:hypothetical protein